MTDAEYIKRLKLVSSLNTNGVENTEECKTGHAIETLISLSSEQCIQNITKFIISMYTIGSSHSLENIKYLYSMSDKQIIEAIFQGEITDCNEVFLRRDIIEKIPIFKNGLLTFNGIDCTLQFSTVRIPHVSDIWIHSKADYILYRTAGSLSMHSDISIDDGLLTVTANNIDIKRHWLRILC